MNEPTNWTPGLAVLGVALMMAATYVALTLRKSKPAAPASDAQKHAGELDARYRSIIDQLRELKAEKHHLDPAAYEAQRADLEKRAADALRARETGAAAAAASATGPSPAAAPAGKAAAAPGGFFGRHPEWKGAIWGGGVVAFFGVLGVLLFQEQKPADQSMSQPGPMQSQQGQAQAPSESGGNDLDRAMEYLQEHPENTEAAAEVGHWLIGRQEWDHASQVTERALGIDPFHVENRIHRAYLRAERGDPAGAQELQHLADTYPASNEALLFLADDRERAGDLAGALDLLERYVSVAPPSEQWMELYQAMARYRRELGQPPAP